VTGGRDEIDEVPGVVAERIRQAILRLQARGAKPSVRTVRVEAEVASRAAEEVLRRWRAGELDLAESWDDPREPKNELLAVVEERKAEATKELADDPVRVALETLRTTTDPLSMAKAGAVLAARRVATVYERGDSIRELDSLKKTLEELRRSEGDYLEIAREKMDLVEKDAALMTLGALVSRYKAALDLFEVRLAGRVEQWIHDQAFLAKTSEERAREIRVWAQERNDETCNALSEDAEMRRGTCSACHQPLFSPESKLSIQLSERLVAQVKDLRKDTKRG
jgi:hypothetical protein